MSTYTSSWSAFNDDEEEEDENFITDGDETRFNNKDSILFVIDCSPSMLEPDAEGEIPFESAIKCVSSVLKNKIISSESDLIGVLFYGTEKKLNSTDFEHIYVLQDLDVPDARRIKDVENIVSGETKFDDFGSTNEEFPLGDVFWTCINMFSASAQKVGSKRIFLFTNEDNPHAANPRLRDAATTRARDLNEVGIRIELFNIDRPDQRFDFDAFYKVQQSPILPPQPHPRSRLTQPFFSLLPQDIIERDEEENGDEEEESPTPSGPPESSRKLTELMVKVRRKEVRKRSLFRLPFQISEGLTMGVKGYTLLRHQLRGIFRQVYMKGERVREVTAVTSWICSDTTQYLLPTDLKFYYPYGGEKVVFTKEELAEIKNFGDPGFTLIGFKPTSALQIYHNLSHPLFIYPDELAYSGSTRVFAALLKKMLELDRIAICSMIRRINTAPRMVALLPQAEVFGDDGGQEKPAGFHVITLPYADDIRDLPTKKTPEGRFGVLVSRIFSSRLTMPPPLSAHPPRSRRGADRGRQEYDREAKHPRWISARELRESCPAAPLREPSDENVPDKTLPKVETIHKRVGKLVQVFKEKVWKNEPPRASVSSVGAGKKRKASDEGESGKAKKGKAAADTGSLDMKALVAQGKVSKCTVPQLKEWLTTVGVKPQGLKADLVALVETYFAEK
ncbi:SPOC like C-terminal domain-containing protein [Jimgerdemannia flammicorona]|uniref:ATP-dependent DNA helicase II subunit 1 n=1 Tax=Jimgerdemannia flammicorona TaxID=994334 RepID=A0A433DD75_9FUNG|nr:SPOC like C-terminal domain-containing protein [Jimgerdemannia flammicorona]